MNVRIATTRALLLNGITQIQSTCAARTVRRNLRRRVLLRLETNEGKGCLNCPGVEVVVLRTRRLDRPKCTSYFGLLGLNFWCSRRRGTPSTVCRDFHRCWHVLALLIKTIYAYSSSVATEALVAALSLPPKWYGYRTPPRAYSLTPARRICDNA